jgi:hypothetical protein
VGRGTGLGLDCGLNIAGSVLLEMERNRVWFRSWIEYCCFLVLDWEVGHLLY